MIYIVSNSDICRCSIATNDFVSIYMQSHADEKHSKRLGRHADINLVPYYFYVPYSPLALIHFTSITDMNVYYKNV